MSNKGGAPKGNQNLKNASRWNSAMKKVIASKGKDEKGISVGLFNLASKMYEMALEGDIAAQKEFLDRFAGKVTQGVEVESTQYLVMIGGNKMVEREPIVITPDKLERSH